MAASGALSLAAMTLNPGGTRDHPIAVAHPHIEHAPAARVAIVLQSIEQRASDRRAYLGRAEFAM
jgi:hypothetical protein